MGLNGGNATVKTAPRRPPSYVSWPWCPGKSPSYTKRPHGKRLNDGSQRASTRAIPTICRRQRAAELCPDSTLAPGRFPPSEDVAAQTRTTKALRPCQRRPFSIPPTAVYSVEKDVAIRLASWDLGQNLPRGRKDGRSGTACFSFGEASGGSAARLVVVAEMLQRPPLGRRPGLLLRFR